MNPKNYIGGNFSSTDLDEFTLISGEKPDSFFPEHIKGLKRVYMETGTDAMASIIDDISNGSNPIKLWFPLNYCQDTIDKLLLKKSKLIIEKYVSINELSLDRNFFHVVLVLHFNGHDNNVTKEITHFKTKNKSVIIEDFVHCPFDIAQLSGNYAFNSLRKVVDVEIAVTYKTTYISPAINDSSYRKIKTKAAELKASFFETQDTEIEKKYLDLFLEAEVSLKNSQILPASDNEIFRLNGIDLKKIRNTRIVNFSCLKTLLADVPEIEVLNGDYMFLMISCKDRDSLRRALFKGHIFAPVHWLDSNSEISKHILSLPIDQRYSKYDMERIASVIKQHYN